MRSPPEEASSGDGRLSATREAAFDRTVSEHAAIHRVPNPNEMDVVLILGVRIVNASKAQALSLIERLVSCDNCTTTHPVFIANAHTLNLAAESAEYRDVLTSAFCVFGDGTGIRWAARQRGVKMKDNLVGTDLVPAILSSMIGRGLRYYLLGADSDSIESAARYCRREFPDWELAGYSPGYLDEESTGRVIRAINRSRPHLLLVGMGNPIQEQWIHAHRDRLQAPVAIGVGGLFDHWAGNLSRAPFWLRKLGYEWLQLLIQQPHKWRRYILGNPKFLYRVARRSVGERRAPGSELDSHG